MARNVSTGVPKKAKEYPIKVKFSKLAKKMLVEVTLRHQKEFNEALVEVYDDMNLLARVEDSQETGETFELQRDFSGLIIRNPKVEEERLKKQALKEDEESQKKDKEKGNATEPTSKAK